MLENVADQGLEHLHLEANCRPKVRKLLIERPKIVAKLGYELFGHHDHGDEATGEEFCWMRFTPVLVGIAEPQDSNVYSPDLLEELETSERWRRNSLERLLQT